MTIAELPRGLRYVVAYVDLDGRFPPRMNSEKDIALLRAANVWLRRQAKGSSDIFLFVSIGSSTADRLSQTCFEYGFPGSSVFEVVPEPQGRTRRFRLCNEETTDLFGDDQVVLDAEYGGYLEAAQEAAGIAVRQWLEKEHPAAISFPGAEYDTDAFWWVGIERSEDVGEWTIGSDDLVPLLPEAHVEKATTWLSILWPVIEEYGLTNMSPCTLGQEHAVAWVAGLSAWLHGFEAASGNSFNCFDADAAVRVLGLSPFFLGFEAARLSGDDLESFCGTGVRDLEELWSRALGLILEDFRSELRSGLSTFFGGDVALFFALHSAIWPCYGSPMTKALDALTGSDDYESLADLDASWSFVTDGWCEQADE